MNKWYSKTTNVGSPSEQGLVIDESTGRNVAVAYDPKDGPLLAAAPELLAALELHIAFLDSLNKGWLGKTTGDVGLLNKAYIKGSEALAKAKGESA